MLPWHCFFQSFVRRRLWSFLSIYICIGTCIFISSFFFFAPSLIPLSKGLAVYSPKALKSQRSREGCVTSVCFIVLLFYLWWFVLSSFFFLSFFFFVVVFPLVSGQNSNHTIRNRACEKGQRARHISVHQKSKTSPQRITSIPLLVLLFLLLLLFICLFIRFCVFVESVLSVFFFFAF